MNPKLLPVYLLFVCQSQLVAEPAANEMQIFWSTVSPSGTYAVAQSEANSTSKDNDKAGANRDPATQLSILNIQSQQPVLAFSGFKAVDFAPLDLTDSPMIHAFCAWAPQEDHLLIVNVLDPFGCLLADVPDGRVSEVGSTLLAAAARIANRRTTRKTKSLAQPANFSIIDAHFISSQKCYLTVDYESGSGSQRRVDLYFQVNAGANSLAFERSEPYPNPSQPLGASILAGRQVEHLYQTLRGILNDADRQILTMEQQSWLGGRELLTNYEDRVTFAQTRIAELRQKLKEELQKK
ncbi:MAG: hypothetical protein JO170_06205 [Verrucomicrobia bacterium]|nr:hypothetical protein [Verrucomicrobiota bacterium]